MNARRASSGVLKRIFFPDTAGWAIRGDGFFCGSTATSRLYLLSPLTFLFF